MLQDICEGKIDYDLFATTRTGLADEEHIPFEKSPADLPPMTGKKLLRVDTGHIYLLQDGCKRSISNPSTLSHRNLRGVEMIEVDSLTGNRIPTGCPIVGSRDL
jgi:hypothetical protein